MLMCVWAEVSRSGFYEWLARPASATARHRFWLAVQVAKVFRASNGVYGYRKIHAELVNHGIDVGDELVRRLMSELGLVSCHPRPWRITTIQGDGACGPVDLLKRDFTAATPGVRFVGDITYLSTWEGWLYLSTVIDLCTREVVGWAMADHMRASLVCDSLTMAATRRVMNDGAVFHSDRGCQGGFNGSSQHLDHGGSDGSASWLDDGVDGAFTDELAGSAFAS